MDVTDISAIKIGRIRFYNINIENQFLIIKLQYIIHSITITTFESIVEVMIQVGHKIVKARETLFYCCYQAYA